MTGGDSPREGLDKTLGETERCAGTEARLRWRSLVVHCLLINRHMWPLSTEDAVAAAASTGPGRPRRRRR